MTHEELISLAKQASTPDVQYIVESTFNPVAGIVLRVRRYVELSGIETIYCDITPKARPLVEGIDRMQREVEAHNLHAKRSANTAKHVTDEAILDAIKTHERMCGGEGASTDEIAEAVGFSSNASVMHRLKALMQNGLVRCYEDPMTFSKRYKAVKKR